MRSSQAAPRTRAVLLGASNLTASLPVVVDLARQALGSPLDLYAALGRGRSYGARSSFLARSLPGIGQCDLWSALAREPARPTWALVSDLGNDLAFGQEPAVIAAWVEGALDRLEALGASTILSSVPVENLRRMPPWKFELTRRILFPGHALRRAKLIADAGRLDGLLRELARARGVHWVELQPQWYGADPIHFARAQRRRAWSTLLSPWLERRRVPVGPVPAGGLDWRSELLAPAERHVLGVRLRREQPCMRLADGTALHLY